MAEIVEHVGDAAGEGQHDDQEGYQEHENILQHDSDAEDDGSEVFGDDPSFDALENGESEGDSPEYSPRGLHSSDVTVRVRVFHHVLQHPDDQPHQEEAVGDDVVVVPEGEVSFLEPSGVRVGLLQPPEEGGCTDVPEAVGGDEDCQGSIHPVYAVSRGSVHVKLER